jgi:predicted PurR-regulated permease PerM
MSGNTDIATGRADSEASHRPLSADDVMRIVRETMPLAVVSLAVLAALYTLYFAADLFLPIFLALFLSVLLRPIVRSLRQIGLPETLGALVVLVGVTGCIAGAAANLSAPIESWMDRLPSLQREIEAKLWPVTQSIERAKKATEKIEDLAEGERTAAESPEVTIKGPSLLERAFELTWLTLVQLLITLALTFFFLAQNSEQAKRTIRKLPWRGRRESLEETVESIQKALARYLRVSAVIYIVLGILTAAAMHLLQMPNPILWGALAALFGFVPYIGPMIVLGCIGVVSLLTFDTWWQVVAPPAVYATMSVVEGYFITPTVLGRHLTLNPILIFLSMLAWTWVWGMPGALLSVPILVLATMIVRHMAARLRDAAAADPAAASGDLVATGEPA